MKLTLREKLDELYYVNFEGVYDNLYSKAPIISTSKPISLVYLMDCLISFPRDLAKQLIYDRKLCAIVISFILYEELTYDDIKINIMAKQIGQSPDFSDCTYLKVKFIMNSGLYRRKDIMYELCDENNDKVVDVQKSMCRNQCAEINRDRLED